MFLFMSLANRTDLSSNQKFRYWCDFYRYIDYSTVLFDGNALMICFLQNLFDIDDILSGDRIGVLLLLTAHAHYSAAFP